MDKRALVVRNSDNPNEEGDFEGGIFFYKARKIEDHGDFTIGCDSMWKYHLAQYNDHYESEEEEKLDTREYTKDAPRKKSEMAVQLRRTKPPSAAQVQIVGR